MCFIVFEEDLKYVKYAIRTEPIISNIFERTLAVSPWLESILTRVVKSLRRFYTFQTKILVGHFLATLSYNVLYTFCTCVSVLES